MTAITDKQAALDRIGELAEEFGLSAAEISAHLKGSGEAEPARRTQIMGRLLSYLGGIFVFAGIATFIGIQWDQINSAARVVITLGPGLSAFVLAILALRDQRFQQAATPLFITAAVLEPTGMLVAFHEYGGGGDWRVATMITTATVGIQYGAAFARFGRTTLALFAIIFASFFWVTALDKIGMEDELIALTIGAALTLVGVQVHRSAHTAISPVVFLFGSWSFLFGVFDLVEQTPLEVIFLAIACGVTYLGIVIRSRTLNFTSTIAILAYVGYFTAEHFADSIGWPLALIAFGLALIGISAAALRIDRKYLRSN